MTIQCLLKLLLCVSVVFTGCKEAPPTPNSQIDEALRTFMGIETMLCPFTLPKSTTAYYPVVIFFTDGKEVGRVKHTMSGMDTKVPFAGNIQLVWQFDSNVFRRATLINGSSSKELSDAFPNWQAFSTAAWQVVPMDMHLTYENISILGVTSTPAGIPVGMQAQDLKQVVSATKHVVAIGIVYGSDYDAVRAEFSSTPKPPQ